MQAHMLRQLRLNRTAQVFDMAYIRCTWTTDGWRYGRHIEKVL